MFIIFYTNHYNISNLLLIHINTRRKDTDDRREAQRKDADDIRETKRQEAAQLLKRKQLEDQEYVKDKDHQRNLETMRVTANLQIAHMKTTSECNRYSTVTNTFWNAGQNLSGGADEEEC